MSGGIQKLTKFLSKFEEYFIAFLMAAMTAVNFANVFVRYVLKSNIPWALEFTVISFAWIIFLGAAWGIKACLLYTSPSPRDRQKSRMPSSA